MHVAVLNDFHSINGLFYKKKLMAWCSDTRCEMKSQPTTTPPRERLQHF